MTKRKVAFITGSGRNIGRSAAFEMAGRGFDVVVTGGRNRAECEAVAAEVRKHDVAAKVVMGDLATAADVKRIADEALAEFGAIDVFIGNAAIRPSADFLDLKPADWRHVLAVNLESTILLAQAFLPGMIAGKWGRIILFTGRMAIRASAGNAALAFSKHAVWGLTKGLAKEFARSGITANAVSPGSILTEREGDWTERRKADAKEIPAGRIGLPEEVAALCGFLASDEAAFVNGQMIGVNGGIET